MKPLSRTTPPKPGESGTCPHCGVYAHFLDSHFQSDEWHHRMRGFELEVTVATCPSCQRPVVRYSVSEEQGGAEETVLVANRLIWPPGPTLRVPEQVGESIRSDFLEAAEILSISPKASAALSRRCLGAACRRS